MQKLIRTIGLLALTTGLLVIGTNRASAQQDYELDLVKTLEVDTMWVDVVLKQTGAPVVSGFSGVLLSGTIDLLYDPSEWVYGYQTILPPPNDTSIYYDTFPRQFNAFGSTYSYGNDVGNCANCVNPGAAATTNTIPSRGQPEPVDPWFPDACNPPTGTCTDPVVRLTIATAINITNPIVVTGAGVSMGIHKFVRQSPAAAATAADVDGELTLSKTLVTGPAIPVDSTSLVICYASGLTGPTYSCCTGDGNPPTGQGQTGIGFCTITDEGALPVELAGFDAIQTGDDIVLSWETASESNNAGFSIEHVRGDGEEFAELAFVEGHGTTTEPQHYEFTATGLDIGRHRFRLRQVDFDGAFEYSDVIESTIELAGTHRLGAAYPNPFNPSTTFELIVGRNQLVQVDVINALGQRVQRLFNGPMEANDPKNFVFEAGTLPSGLYFYRVAGETFAETKQMLLVK